MAPLHLGGENAARPKRAGQAFDWMLRQIETSFITPGSGFSVREGKVSFAFSGVLNSRANGPWTVAPGGWRDASGPNS